MVMDQWLGFGILLLGVGLGALLTRIADIALRRTQFVSGGGNGGEFRQEGMVHLQAQGRVRGRREQIRGVGEEGLGER